MTEQNYVEHNYVDLLREHNDEDMIDKLITVNLKTLSRGDFNLAEYNSEHLNLQRLINYLSGLLATIQVPWYERYFNFKRVGEKREKWRTLIMCASLTQLCLAIKKQAEGHYD